MAFNFSMFLPPEARAGLDIINGEDPRKVAASYTTGQIMSNGVDSLGGTDALGNSQEQLFNDKLTADQLNESIPNPMDNMDIPTDYQYAPKIDAPITQPGMYENAINNPMDNFAGLPEAGIAGQGEIPIEEPGTFLGLEGKDYTKMGMQGVLAAGVSAAQPTPVQPSKAPVGPGMTKGSPIQAQAPGVNSMVRPDPRLNSMQMTQAQGLISPFQRDRLRRGQY